MKRSAMTEHNASYNICEKSSGIKSENAQGANEDAPPAQTCHPPFPMCNGLALALGSNSLQRDKQREENTGFDSKSPDNRCRCSAGRSASTGRNDADDRNYYGSNHYRWNYCRSRLQHPVFPNGRDMKALEKQPPRHLSRNTSSRNSFHSRTAGHAIKLQQSRHNV